VVSANAVQLVSAGFSTCVRSAGGELSCWGWDQAHRFSDVLYQATPTLITSLGTTVRQAAVGNTLACVLRDDDTTWCWGDYIRSGTDEVHIASPTQVAPLGTDATEVTLNGHHVCARKSDGSAWCWGYNASGELGDGTMNPSDDPVMVMGLGTSVAHVCAGWSHSCALDTSGAVWCWGNGTVGQLGQGSTISSTVPMRLDLLGADVVDLACSGQATCARKSDESVWCWGGRIAPLFGMEGFGAALPTPTVIPESVECLPGPI
jgi:alpha-tubulin suppressor-like RCC1 family protein